MFFKSKVFCFFAAVQHERGPRRPKYCPGDQGTLRDQPRPLPPSHTPLHRTKPTSSSSSSASSAISSDHSSTFIFPKETPVDLSISIKPLKLLEFPHPPGILTPPGLIPRISGPNPSFPCREDGTFPFSELARAYGYGFLPEIHQHPQPVHPQLMNYAAAAVAGFRNPFFSRESVQELAARLLFSIVHWVRMIPSFTTLSSRDQASDVSIDIIRKLLNIFNCRVVCLVK